MNANYDRPPETIPLPKRAPVMTHDIIEIERKIASTQNKDKNQNKTMKIN